MYDKILMCKGFHRSVIGRNTKKCVLLMFFMKYFRNILEIICIFAVKIVHNIN